MTKKLLLGALVGGAAAYFTWKKLPQGKQAELQSQLQDVSHDVADQVTDYALNALDIIDEKLAEHDSSLDDASEKASEYFGKVRDAVKNGTDKAVSHFTDDDFDEQTADIRKELANAKKGDDIVIDATDKEDTDQD